VRLWLAAAFLIVLLLAALAYGRIPGHRDSKVFATSPPTPYFHYTPTGISKGKILVVHGLDASKSVTNIISSALADAGFEVFSIDLPGHGDSSVPFTAFSARDAVEQVLNVLGPETVALGHSLGGALLLDIANDRPVPKLILFSPAPIPLEPVRADRILVLEGQFDPGHMRAFASQIRAAAPNVEVREMRWTGHSGGLLRPSVIDSVVKWLDGSTQNEMTERRLELLAVMLVSGLAAGVTLLGLLPATNSQRASRDSVSISVVSYLIAVCLAAAFLSFVPLFSWLRLYATDYFVGILFGTGLLLLLRFRVWVHTSFRNVLISVLSVLFLLGLIYVVGTELADVTLSATRWWRFPAITLLCFPLCLADQAMVRPVLALVSRVMVGAIVVTAGLTLHRDAAFLLLLMPAVLGFWIVLWFLTGAVRRRTDAVSAALFAALIQAWVFSALFVST